MKREKRENEVRERARLRINKKVVLPTQAATNVKVVDEAMMTEELKTGRMGGRTEARHLMLESLGKM